MKEVIFGTAERDYMGSCIGHIRSELERLKIDEKDILKTELISEESVLKLVKYAPESADIRIRVKKFFGGATVEIRAEGDRIEELSDGGNISYAAQALENEEEEIDSGLLIIKANKDRIRYSGNDGVNLIRIKSGKSDKSSMYLTVLSLIISMIVGLLFRRFVPDTVNTALCEYLFIPVRTMFINALRIIVGPVVFFSIVTCISQFTNLSELGRIGAKVLGMYMFTTIIAICVGMGMFYLISPGEQGVALKNGVEAAVSSAEAGAPASVLDTIVNIVPSNFIKPFAESDTLQIIFLAVLLGAAVGMIGSYSKVIKDLFEAFNELFLTVTSMIARFIPLAVFAAMFVMIIETGADSMIAMFSMAGTVVLSLFIMMLVYCILILVIGRLNPLTFFRKNWPGMLTAFTLSSSNAAMPTNMQICTDRMGISPKVCNFSIPLGATVNMDGACIYFAVAALFLAKCYGVEVPASAMLSLVITIIMLSLGTPGVPGSSAVGLGVLLYQLGVPIEAVGMIMGVDALLDMFRTVSNTTGDMAVTLIVAKTENLLDVKKYQDK